MFEFLSLILTKILCNLSHLLEYHFLFVLKVLLYTYSQCDKSVFAYLCIGHLLCVKFLSFIIPQEN